LVFFLGGWIVYSINDFLIISLEDSVRVMILWTSIVLFVILTIVQMMLEFRHKKLLAFPLPNISPVEKRWILSKILLMIGTAILTTWLQLVAQ
jgi:heme/copper-type cytochrome/quinol oxidase subunit 2